MSGAEFSAADLAAALLERGVSLRLGRDDLGRPAVNFRAPAGAITEEIRTVAATMRDDLLALVEDYEERAGIYEHDAGLDRAEAERQAWADVLASVASEARQAA